MDREKGPMDQLEEVRTLTGQELSLLEDLGGLMDQIRKEERITQEFFIGELAKIYGKIISLEKRVKALEYPGEKESAK